LAKTLRPKWLRYTTMSFGLKAITSISMLKNGFTMLVVLL
jgi:hypothetical protein